MEQTDPCPVIFQIETCIQQYEADLDGYYGDLESWPEVDRIAEGLMDYLDNPHHPPPSPNEAHFADDFPQLKQSIETCSKEYGFKVKEARRENLEKAELLMRLLNKLQIDDYNDHQIRHAYEQAVTSALDMYTILLDIASRSPDIVCSEGFRPQWEQLFPVTVDRVGMYEPAYREEHVLYPLWCRISAKLSWNAASKCEEASKRAIEIWRIIQDLKGDGNSIFYLGRVLRCYVWGFDTECIMLCRSVIDSAFRDFCDRHYPDEQLERCGLAQRINLTQERGHLDGNAYRLAEEIRNAGNKAIHYEPTDPEHNRVKHTIKNTVSVLTALANA